MLDENNVYLMDKPVKIYLFKDKDEVKVSFRVTDYCNIHRYIETEKFEYILANWRTGVEGLETRSGKYYWYYSDCGPRPDCVPAQFVVINTREWSFRISVQDMEQMEAEYEHQKHNKMHWDG